MISPENGAVSYIGNLLYRVSGVAQFEKSRRDALVWGVSNSGASTFGFKDAFCKLMAPSITTEEARSAGENWKSSIVLGLKMVPELYIGLGIPFMLLAYGKPIEAIEARIAYNFAAEIIPDALRAIRRNFNPPANLTLMV